MPDMTARYKHMKNSLRLTDEVLESKKSKIYSYTQLDDYGTINTLKNR